MRTIVLRKLRAFGLIAAALLVPAAASGQTIEGGGAEAPDASYLCIIHAVRMEQKYHLPDGLLVAIAMTETGRYIAERNASVPWPWTMNAVGEPHYFDGKDPAMIKAADYLRRGIGSIDVGCMGINLYHHPSAFKTLGEAFDPAANVGYSANFLLRLYKRYGDWSLAVSAYHNGKPEIGHPYRARVWAQWKKNSYDLRDVAREAYLFRDYTVAADLYRAALDKDAGDATALAGLAASLEALGWRAEARQAYERLLRADPDSADAIAWLVEDARALPVGDAIARLSRLQDVSPAAADFPARIALLQIDSGRFADALANMKEAVRLAPDAPVYRYNVAVLYDRLGDTDQAMTSYDHLLRAYPQERLAGMPVDQVRRRLDHLRKVTRQQQQSAVIERR